MPKRPTRPRLIVAAASAIALQLITVAVAAAGTNGGDFPRRVVERFF